MNKYLLCLTFIWSGYVSAQPTSSEPGVLLYDELNTVSCPVPLKAKTPAKAFKASPANSKRFIHARGVGEVLIAQFVPDPINELEGGPYDADFRKAASSMEHYEAMAQGYFNMDGYPTIKLKKLDLVITHALDMRVLSLSPGPQLRTVEGTGMGSTLVDLKQAHGGFSMLSGPEPYHCSVSAKGLPFVSFMYTDCSKACQGEGALKVYVSGAHYDYSEQRWKTPSLYPLPKGYQLPKGMSSESSLDQ